MGRACREISAEWGAQRIKGLSVAKALAHALASPFRNSADTAQKQHRNQSHRAISLSQIRTRSNVGGSGTASAERGGQIHLRHRIVGVERDGAHVTAVNVLDEADRIGPTGCLATISFRRCRSATSSHSFNRRTIAKSRRIAERLPYRDFMTVGLLLRRMNSGSTTGGDRRSPTACRRTIGFTSKSRT